LKPPKLAAAAAVIPCITWTLVGRRTRAVLYYAMMFCKDPDTRCHKQQQQAPQGSAGSQLHGKEVSTTT
jgi:hypothetical protein